MKTTAQFLDLLRLKLDLPSDGQLADHLGMHRQHVSRYRTLNGTFDDAMAMRIADILGTDPAFVVACMHAQRAKRTEEKKLWERIADSMAAIAAVLVLTVTLYPTASPTSPENGLLLASSSPALYIMSNLETILFSLCFSVLILCLGNAIMARHTELNHKNGIQR